MGTLTSIFLFPRMRSMFHLVSGHPHFYVSTRSMNGKLAFCDLREDLVHRVNVLVGESVGLKRQSSQINVERTEDEDNLEVAGAVLHEETAEKPVGEEDLEHDIDKVEELAEEEPGK